MEPKMNQLEIAGKWNELKGKLRQRFAILTDDDVEFTNGKEEELFGRLQTRLGKTKEQIREIIAGL